MARGPRGGPPSGGPPKGGSPKGGSSKGGSPKGGSSKGGSAKGGSHKGGPPGAGPPRPPFPDQLEGRNLALTALRASPRVRLIWLDAAAGGDKIDELRTLAARRGVAVRAVAREDLDRISEADVHNGVIAFADGLPHRTLKEVLDDAFAARRDPLVVLLDQVQYEQNLGAILRTCAAVAVDAVVVPTRRGASLSAVAQRVAMGGAEEVPVIREGMMSALATLRRAGVRVVGTDAEAAVPFTAVDLRGPLALVLGGEDRGLSSAVAERCDAVARIPMRPGGAVTSLNVSVSTALLLYERVRQSAPR